jgi:uncharacterized protein YodC (DUF2158 family)
MSETREFRTGDVVVLRSGGPRMTVRNHSGGEQAVLVIWFDAEGEPQEQWYDPAQLVSCDA